LVQRQPKNSSQYSILKKPSQKRAGRVAQGAGQRFKSQHHNTEINMEIKA
jgi:hypothetical protein